MTSFFSSAFIAALSANQSLLDGAAIQAVLFRQAPLFEPNDPRYTDTTTIPQLLATPGWVPITAGGDPLANTVAMGVRQEGKNNYLMFSQFPFTNLPPNEAMAIAFLTPDDKIIFVTNTPFGGEMMVVRDGDGITAAPDAGLSGASNRWLLSWADPPQGGTTIVAILEGPLMISLGPPEFEPSHAQHVWLYPQRANMIANPSFEKPGMAYWGTNGVASRVPLADKPVGAGSFAGKFTGSGTVILESNTFPTSREEQWTVQFMAKGTGKVKVGFVWWDDDFDEASVDWGILPTGGTETWELNPDVFIHIATCRAPVQTYQALLRIECDGGDITIDQVLCERGFLKDWNYFDGDTTYGAREDFVWYGGEVRQGASYSFWYNNKRAVFGRLFAREIDDDVLITDEVMAKQGFVYRWVPAGTLVIPHIDVLYPNDLQLEIPAKTGVLSYRVDIDRDLQGVKNPWV